MNGRKVKTHARDYNNYSTIMEYERWKYIWTIIKVPENLTEIKAENMQF